MNQVIGLPIDKNLLLTRVRDEASINECPRCGGELTKTEHLNEVFDIVLEIRCNGCGYNKLAA